MAIFPIRRAVERLRAGLFDPVAVGCLTIKEEAVVEAFSEGLEALQKGKSTHLCICGSYGQGKSHNLAYLRQKALSEGYAVSFLQLDIREVPFHQFSVVYQSLIKNLSLPTGELFIEAWKKCSVEIGEEMPHRFRMILQALVSKNKIPLAKSKKKNGLDPQNFDHWLNEAFGGCNLPAAHLKQILKSRNVNGYKEQSLACRGNLLYMQMVQSLGKLLYAMGYKGLVLFFDEAESLVQSRLNNRIKSYEILNYFFSYSGFVYPIFAFTESFFDVVRSEKYDTEEPQWPQNYAEAWKNLRVLRLQDCPLNRLETLQDRLIDLYEQAYQIDLSVRNLEIKQQMRNVLEKWKTQEMRLKLKALINQLDTICTRTAS